MSVEDKIEYVQALWDRIAANESQAPVPDRHRGFFTSDSLTIRPTRTRATLGRGGGRSSEATGMTSLIRPLRSSRRIDPIH